MRNKYIKWCLTPVLLLFVIQATAQRNWLTNSVTPTQLSSYLSTIDQWRKTEKTTVLQNISHLPDSIKEAFIRDGEKALAFQWPNLPATVFLQFSETGNRSNYESIRKKRRRVLSTLVIAELVEQKGRFIPQIINGIWAICEESTWAFPAHLSIQHHYTPLPNPGENIIDLGDGMTAGLISWTYFLLHHQLDSVAKVIPKRMYYELQKRVIQPYLARDDFWWMGFHGQNVNNWNPWCNGNVLLTAALTEKDTCKLDSTVYKTMRSIDHFINQYPADGGCDEGPSYWSVAGGALISYLNLLKSMTNKNVDISSHLLIGNMGKYIYRMNINKNYFVNFGDAHPTTTPDITSVFDFGKACNNDTLKRFAAYFAKRRGKTSGQLLYLKNDLPKFIKYLNIYKELRSIPPRQPLIKEAWLPDLQVLTVRSEKGSFKGLFLAAKGGTNGESHNHNDLGNFIIYVNGKPAIIDIGVGTYTKQTFSKNRYKIFTMQSAWHNLPTINGVMQHAGSKYKATDVRLSHMKEGTKLSMNIANAYPEDADVKSWIRTLEFHSDEIKLRENYILKTFKNASTLSLITPLDAKAENHSIILSDHLNNKRLEIKFDANDFKVTIESKTLADPILQHAWGDHLNRILLTVKSHKLKGQYQLSFRAL